MRTSMLHPPADSMAEPETPELRVALGDASSIARRRCKGVWQHPPYFHDGSAATLEGWWQTYNTRRSLGLSAQQIGRPGRST